MSQRQVSSEESELCFMNHVSIKKFCLKIVGIVPVTLGVTGCSLENGVHLRTISRSSKTYLEHRKEVMVDSFYKAVFNEW